MRRLCLVLLLCLGVARAEPPLQVFAAASLTEVFEKLGQEFQARHPGTKIVFNFAGSQQLVHQLAQGARADVLATADTASMEAAEREGVVGQPTTLARNRLIVVMPAENPAGLTSYRDLARPGLKVVLADRQVPAGAYSLRFLQHDPAFARAVLGNVVSYEPSVRGVLAKVALGEADAGIVYVTDARTQKVGCLGIPDPLNPVATYPVATVRDSPRAREFIEFCRSSRGQRILTEHGFLPALRP